jgi:hypothetical protein
MSKKIAILQSNYIPWKGYFDLINMVDEFIIYDEMQFTRRDWRNRNKIKTSNGLIWLTIPVEVKGKYYQKINETLVADHDWAKKHWNIIKQFYKNATYFNDYKEMFENFYLSTEDRYLSLINRKLIEIVNEILNVKTKISWSSEYRLTEGKTEKLINLVQQASGTEYVSGPTAKAYVAEELFVQADIKLTWMDYTNYKEYNQLYPPFEHAVTVLDLIFNEGPNASKFFKTFLNGE